MAARLCHLRVISFSIMKDVIYLLLGHAACEILVTQPGIEPVPPALGAWSLNHWTAREVPSLKNSNTISVSAVLDFRFFF